VSRRQRFKGGETVTCLASGTRLPPHDPCLLMGARAAPKHTTGGGASSCTPQAATSYDGHSLHVATFWARRTWVAFTNCLEIVHRATLDDSLSALAPRNSVDESGTAMAHDGASSISVTVRVRPFTIREAAQLSKSDDHTLFLGEGSLAGAPTSRINSKGIKPVIKVLDEKCLYGRSCRYLRA
jgi:hypothetical protein